MYYLAQRIEDLVEVNQNLALGHFCNVVHALAGIVADAGILVREAGEDGRDYFLEISGDFLSTVSPCSGQQAAGRLQDRGQ